MSSGASIRPEFHDPATARIVQFLIEIGLPVWKAEIPNATFLPGIQMESGGLRVDETALAHCGDLLHEAGHLAILPSAERHAAGPDAGADAGNEMASIAWSYAAALHLGLDPAVVFHDDGYRGGARAILDNFREGRTFGVPLLQYMGLTVDASRAGALGVEPYPNMLRWLRT